MNKSKLLLLGLLLITLLGSRAMQSYADSVTPGFAESPAGDGPALKPADLAATVDLSEAIATTPLAAATRGLTAPFTLPEANLSPAGTEVCTQLLLNTALDVLVGGGGGGTAEPWVVLWSIVYYSTVEYVSPDHSLLVEVADDGDPNPDYDGFGQAFYMPNNLTSVQIQYYTATVNPNSVDYGLGELWLLDSDGYLDTRLLWWEVGQSVGVWQQQTVNITNASQLNSLEGQYLAIAMGNETLNSSPPGETTYYDDVRLTACYTAPNIKSYLPVTLNTPATNTAYCNLPTEPDSWYTGRGLVTTGGNCNGSLSQVDDRDYFTFTPTQSGNHTFYLRNLPSGSNWAALVYDLTEPPPGGPTNSGNCYTSQSGSGDKQVTCNLTAGQNYVIKVSAGSTPISGSYQMQVTRP